MSFRLCAGYLGGASGLCCAATALVMTAAITVCSYVVFVCLRVVREIADVGAVHEYIQEEKPAISENTHETRIRWSFFLHCFRTAYNLCDRLLFEFLLHLESHVKEDYEKVHFKRCHDSIVDLYNYATCGIMGLPLSRLM